MGINVAASEDSQGNEKYVFGNWSKGNPCPVASESFEELCRMTTWKSRFASDELTYLPEDISQSFKILPRVSSASYSKM